MRKHKLRVKLLSEFCSKGLLGQNTGGGLHVQLRLRRRGRDNEFLPFHEVRDTMLHELCHKVHSPYNASFYKLLDQLRKELKNLIDKGGFNLKGRRLGGVSRKPLRSLGATAAMGAKRTLQGIIWYGSDFYSAISSTFVEYGMKSKKRKRIHIEEEEDEYSEEEEEEEEYSEEDEGYW